MPSSKTRFLINNRPEAGEYPPGDSAQICPHCGHPNRFSPTIRGEGKAKICTACSQDVTKSRELLVKQIKLK